MSPELVALVSVVANGGSARMNSAPLTDSVNVRNCTRRIVRGSSDRKTIDERQRLQRRSVLEDIVTRLDPALSFGSLQQVPHGFEYGPQRETGAFDEGAMIFVRHNRGAMAQSRQARAERDEWLGVAARADSDQNEMHARRSCAANPRESTPSIRTLVVRRRRLRS